jgi:hypothetical protein
LCLEFKAEIVGRKAAIASSSLRRSPSAVMPSSFQILDENGPLRTEKKADWLDGEDYA